MPDHTLTTLHKTLRRRHLSLTRPRRVVFYALQKRPQTMSELIANCRPIDRSTVYRTALLFESVGVLHRLHIGWKYKLELTGNFMPHHHHFSCNICGTVVTLAEDPLLERRLQILAAQYDFITQDHQLEIRGVCVKCRPTTDSPRA